MARRRRRQNEPIDDPIAVVARQAEVLLRRGLAEQAAASILRFAREAAQDRREREETPIDDWSVTSNQVGLTERLRAALADTPYTTIGQCMRATDEDLLALPQIGPGYLAEIREAIAHTVAIYSDRPE